MAQARLEEAVNDLEEVQPVLARRKKGHVLDTLERTALRRFVLARVDDLMFDVHAGGGVWGPLGKRMISAPGLIAAMSTCLAEMDEAVGALASGASELFNELTALGARLRDAKGRLGQLREYLKGKAAEAIGGYKYERTGPRGRGAVAWGR
jgi:hypothetical protein